MIATTIEPSLGVAFGLTALLVVSSGRDEVWQCGRVAARIPRWVPWAVLASLAVASTVFGFVHPDTFSAIGGEGIVWSG